MDWIGRKSEFHLSVDNNLHFLWFCFAMLNNWLRNSRHFLKQIKENPANRGTLTLHNIINLVPRAFPVTIFKMAALVRYLKSGEGPGTRLITLCFESLVHRCSPPLSGELEARVMAWERVGVLAVSFGDVTKFSRQIGKREADAWALG